MMNNNKLITLWYIMDIHESNKYWVSIGLMKIDNILPYRN